MLVGIVVALSSGRDIFGPHPPPSPTVSRTAVAHQLVSSLPEQTEAELPTRTFFTFVCWVQRSGVGCPAIHKTPCHLVPEGGPGTTAAKPGSPL